MDALTRKVLEVDSILELMAGRAASSLGREAVCALEPLPTLRAIQDRHAPVAELMLLLSANQPPPLGGLFDVTPLFERAHIVGSALEEEDFPRLGVFLDVCLRMARWREGIEATHRAVWKALMGLEPEPNLAATIRRLFDAQGRLRDDASPELRAARDGVRAGQQRLLKTVNRLASDLHARGLLQDNFSTVRNGRYVLPVKVSSKGRVAGIQHGSSASGESVYVEPLEVVEASNEVESLREAERREVHRILLALTTQVREHIPLGMANLHVLADFDALFALASVANDKGWSLPTVVDQGPLRLFTAHHPLLHLRLGAGSVPITMLLDPGDRAIIFSGPNAGGKTTAMKTAGLLAFLARCGAPVPAFPDSTIPMFTKVLADIGDQQDLTQGLSTFSGHMRRLREIWEEADTRTLILLDELGTGTDPQEGGALALALLEGLAKRVALTFTTSHLNPIKQWASETPGVRNASFSLDPSTRAPTFRLRLDLPGASEALEIAEREGIPRGILERARGLVGERHLQMGELLRRIEERERRLATAVREAEARAKALAEQEELAKTRAELLRTERRQMRESSLREREQMIEETRVRLEKMIAELPSEDILAARKAALLRTREELLRDKSLSGEERRRLAQQQLEKGEIVVGMRAYVPSLGQWGEVISIDEQSRKVRLNMGRMEVTAKKNELLDHDPAERQEEAEEAAEELAGQLGGKRRRSRRLKRALRNAEEYSLPTAAPRVTLSGTVLARAAKPTSMMLDLHGFRVEEAIAALEKFLDQSLLADFPYVRINHGLGSGKLYRAVHEYLRGNKAVKKYRFANSDEGGSGVTIVEF